MKKLNGLALSMAFILGTSVLTSNVVRAAGSLSETDAAAASATSRTEKLATLRSLVERLELVEAHFGNLEITITRGYAIPNFSYEEERRWAEEAARCAEVLREYTSDEEIRRLCGYVIEHSRPEYVIKNASGYADDDMAKCVALVRGMDRCYIDGQSDRGCFFALESYKAARDIRIWEQHKDIMDILNFSKQLLANMQ